MPEQPDPLEILGLDPDATAPDPTPGPAGARPRHAAPGAGRRWYRRPPVIALGLVLVVLIGAGWWLRTQIDPGSPGDPVAFTIAKGATTSDVGRSLEQQGIITSATVFGWYLRVTGGGPFQAGEYDGLRRNSSMGSVVQVLEKGPAPPRTVSFLVREGLWLSETRALILETFPEITPTALDGVLASTHPSLQPAGSTNLEGFLFPAKYEVAQTDVGNAQKIVDQMIAAFDRVSAEEGLPSASTKLAGAAGRVTVTPYQALIVASLIESEAKVPEDRPKIARVIYNRMARGEMLGIDASVLYALQQRKSTLTNSDLRVDSPYNTRLRNGLPPTPINSPGQESIHAALNPADGDWLYYVLTDSDGHHYFTSSAADFQRAVADAKARGIF
ncbi:MAG: endolytic transglycosylase MltG [Acidobacteria bacterium]|nr:endolytic transglycosylase MltG [Acidobacteriota bacterium]